MAGSLNRVMLIGRLTRDPELRYTPSGTAVCNIALATNRYGSDPATGARKEFTDYHHVGVWNQGTRKLPQTTAQQPPIHGQHRPSGRPPDRRSPPGVVARRAARRRRRPRRHSVLGWRAMPDFDRRRRKVCSFCLEHIDFIDYKEVTRLRRYLSRSEEHTSE